MVHSIDSFSISRDEAAVAIVSLTASPSISRLEANVLSVIEIDWARVLIAYEIESASSKFRYSPLAQCAVNTREASAKIQMSGRRGRKTGGEDKSLMEYLAEV